MKIKLFNSRLSYSTGLMLDFYFYLSLLIQMSKQPINVKANLLSPSVSQSAESTVFARLLKYLLNLVAHFN